MKIININKKKLNKLINEINLIRENKINKSTEVFLIMTKKNKIYFLINNLNIQIKIKLKIKKNVKKNLLIGINLKKFLKIIKNLKEYKIKIYFIKNKIILKQDKIKYTIKTIKTNNYYKLKFKNKNSLNINIKKIELYDIIKSVYFIISKNNELNKTMLKIKNNNIKIISTDNYRIIYNKIKTENKINIKKNLILHNKVLIIIYKIIENIKIEIINIKINKYQIKIKINKIEIISNVLQIEFPILNEKFEKNYKNKFIINRKNLLMSIKRSITINEKNYNFSKWIIKENYLKIITKSNSEKSEELININCNKNLIIYINNDHILELIKNVKDEKIVFNFPLNNKNIIILLPSKKNFKYITTQVKI